MNAKYSVVVFAELKSKRAGKPVHTTADMSALVVEQRIGSSFLVLGTSWPPT
jgi:hypothetical protein